MSEHFLSTGNIPVTEIKDRLLDEKGIKLFVKRDDLIHPQISGNKWRKLKYNIEELQRQKKDVMLTFGGAYSNHILATAAAGNKFGFKTIGIIRGEEPKENNPVLNYALQSGMKLHFITREAYRNKTSGEFLNMLKKILSDFYLVPEGGANELGVKGCEEIIKEIDIDFTHVCCSTGTGATLAGIALSLPAEKNAIGFGVHKGNESVSENIMRWTNKAKNITLVNDYHFGGFAKSTDELKKFAEQFTQEKGIPVEPVYTAKMFFGIFDLAKRSYFSRGSVIVALHTGGIITC